VHGDVLFHQGAVDVQHSHRAILRPLAIARWLLLKMLLMPYIHTYQKKTGNPGSVVGVACLTVRVTLFLSRIEIEEGFFYVSGFFELAGKILYGILLLLCADSKGFFSTQIMKRFSR